MKELKFFILLSTLDKEEIGKFHKYLKQVHGGSEDALKIFEYARKLYPNPEDDKKLDMNYAISKIFGKEKYSRKNMLNALYDLHLWLKEFLLTEKILEDNLESQVLWLRILQERGLEEEFSKLASRLYDEINSAAKNASKTYLRDLAASHFQHEQLLMGKPTPNLDALQECADNIRICTEIINVKMACQIANLRKIRFAVQEEPSTNDEKVKNKDGKSYALLLLYNEILLLIETEKEVYFAKSQQLLFDLQGYLDADEMHGIFSYLYNFMGTKSRNEKVAVKKLEYGNQLHQLNLYAIKHKLFTPKGNLRPTQFTNIVNVACFVKEFDWANSFIKEYSIFLSDDIRKITVLLTEAQVLFDRNEYKKAVKLLQNEDVMQIKDIDHVIRLRMLILQCYFEMHEEWEKTDNFCVAFESRLGRKSQTSSVEAARAFVQICRMILLGKKSKEEITRIIRSNSNLYQNEWLIKQVNEY